MLRKFLSAASHIFCTFPTWLRFRQLKRKSFEFGHEVSIFHLIMKFALENNNDDNNLPRDA